MAKDVDAGLKLIGFAIWRRREGRGYSVTFPARPFNVNGDTTNFALLRAIDEAYSGISAWTLRNLIASGDLPVVRPPRLRRVWIDRADLDRAIAEWKERSG